MPSSLTDFFNLDDLTSLQILALTLYGEARGEPIDGIVAVGCVIRNRAKKSNKLTPNYRSVCLKPKQFSCWNINDPNRKILEKEAKKWMIKDNSNYVLKQCLYLARGIYLDELFDNTKGADHYMTTELYKSGKISWAKKMKVTKVFGNHTFLKS